MPVSDLDLLDLTPDDTSNSRDTDGRSSGLGRCRYSEGKTEAISPRGKRSEPLAAVAIRMGNRSGLDSERVQSDLTLVVAPRFRPAGPRRNVAPGPSRSRPFPVFEGEALVRPVTDAELDYSTFFRGEFAAVMRTVALMLHDPGRAEEITQDAFIQLLRDWPKISRYERPQAWVRRVAIRLAMRAIRRDRLWSLVRLELLPSAAAPPSRFDVPRAIRRLPGSQRAAIVLHYYEDRPVAEVAVILGCSEPTARVHLHRGRKRLRQLLGEDDDVA